MSSEKSFKINYTATLAGIALGVAVYSAYMVQGQNAEIKALQESQIQMSSTDKGYSFKTEAEFKKSVISTLNQIAGERLEQDLSGKLDKFELAAETVPENRKIYGDLDARFTLVEFSETECPYCIKHQATMTELVDASRGNINWEWKHLPLGFHNPAAITQAVVGECVAKQKGNRMFWVYIDEVFKLSAGNGQGVRDLGGLVESLGVDMGEIRKCSAGSDARAIVDADIKMAQDFNISGTPATFVVDNKTGNSQMLSGAQPAGAFTSAIKRLMDQAEQADDQEATQE